MKLEKISNYALYGVSAVAVVVFVLFFTVGFDNINADISSDKNAPIMTDALLFLMYAMGLVTFGLMIWSLVKGVQNTAGNNELETTGIPGSKITIAVVALTIISLAIGAVVGLGESDFTSTSGVFTPGYMITMVDAFMWSMYILFVVSVVAVVVAATGVLTKTATKK